MKELGIIISNVLTDMPIGFEDEKGEHFCIYPNTLGKMYITSQLVDNLEIDKQLLQVDPFLEALRVVNTKRNDCCRLIAYHTFNSKEDILNSSKIKKRQDTIALFSNDDIATLIIAILKENPIPTISKETGMDEETKRMAKVNAAKKSNNQFIFGGKTIWGTLIDAACERYGWTYDYVVWGISYNNLSLMLKDKVTSIYLSDEEMKKAHITGNNEKVISGDNLEVVMKAVKESDAEN